MKMSSIHKARSGNATKINPVNINWRNDMSSDLIYAHSEIAKRKGN
jgi:hypothetical protein